MLHLTSLLNDDVYVRVYADDGFIKSTDEGMLACQADCTTNYATCEKVTE